jgi:hypothetical protein
MPVSTIIPKKSRAKTMPEKKLADRLTILPASLTPALQRQIQTVQRIHQTDLGDGFGEVHLPHALAAKYPNASCELIWQYLFPPASPLPVGEGLGVRAQPSTFDLLQNGYDTQRLRFWAGVRTVQELLGHKDVKTAMIYTCILSLSKGTSSSAAEWR